VIYGLVGLVKFAILVRSVMLLVIVVTLANWDIRVRLVIPVRCVILARIVTLHVIRVILVRYVIVVVILVKLVKNAIVGFAEVV
jgi:hypothetical protein